MINALLMNRKDNTTVCTVDVRKGDPVTYRKGTDEVTLTAADNIPEFHKIALEDLPEGALVYKYGEIIGKTTAPIVRGGLVDHENIESIPRDYESELVPEE